MKWPIKQLGEVFEIARGGSPRPIDRYITDDPSGYNWIMIGDAQEGSKYITTIKKKITLDGLSKTRQVRPGDFLLTNSMSFGRPYILKTPGCIHDGWLVLSPRSDDVSSDYFYYLLGSDAVKRQFLRGAAGAVVKNLNTTMVKGVTVPLPPLSEQKRIAGILDAADALRSKRREALAQLDTLLQSTFLDMFGDPVTNPMGWERVNFEKVVFFQEGPGVRKWQFRDAGIKLINVKNIVEGELHPENTSRHLDPDEVTRKYAHFLLDQGDLVMSSSGVTWGKIAYVRVNHLPLCLNTSMIRLRPQDSKITHSFIRAFVESESFRRQILRLITGSAQPNFGPSHLRQITIGLPPVDLQRHFAAIVESVEQQKARMRAHLTELDALFASLQSRAFNGEL